MTPLDLLFIILTAVAFHRLWNYEVVYAPMRELADKIPYLRKPLLCPACNAFWFGLVSVAMWKFEPELIRICGIILGSYLAARVVPWLYQNITTWTTKPASQKPPQLPAQPTQPAHPAQPAQSQGKSPTTLTFSGPGTYVLPKLNAAYEKTVVILTALSNFNPSYSVASCVLNQARAIGMQSPTWNVQVWVTQGAEEHGWENMPTNVTLHKIVPRLNWIENQSDEQASMMLRNFMLLHLTKLKNPSIITHDLLFVSWYAVFARALHMVGGLGNYVWFHVPHSLPSDRKGKLAHLTTLPAGNHFITPVAAGYDAKYAEYYDTTVERVQSIPNIKDPRTWGTMTPRVRSLVTKLRLWSYDFVQIFPACTTRLEAKGFSKILQTLAYVKEHASPFVLFCNPNAGGERSVKILAEARAKIKSYGMENHAAFVSDLLPEVTTYGLDASEIKGLMQDYGNLFIFPSMAEADSLIALEAKLCGQYTIMNDDVPTLTADCNWTAHFGTIEKAPLDTCRGVANHVLDMKSRMMTPQRVILRTRNLEKIGDLWKALITGKVIPK